MNKFRHVFIKLYETNVYFVMCSKEKYIQLMIREFNCEIDKIPAEVNGRFDVYHKDNVSIGVIWVSNWHVFAHEIFHCVCWILRRKGIPFTEGTEEAYAYLISYLDKEFRR